MIERVKGVKNARIAQIPDFQGGISLAPEEISTCGQRIWNRTVKLYNDMLLVKKRIFQLGHELLHSLRFVPLRVDKTILRTKNFFNLCKQI